MEQLELGLEKLPTAAERQEMERAGGGMLPVYVPREAACHATGAAAGELACFYCGFARGGGHDSACRFSWWQDELNAQDHGGNTYVDVPKGGVPASESFF